VQTAGLVEGRCRWCSGDAERGAALLALAGRDRCIDSWQRLCTGHPGEARSPASVGRRTDQVCTVGGSYTIGPAGGPVHRIDL